MSQISRSFEWGKGVTSIIYSGCSKKDTEMKRNVILISKCSLQSGYGKIELGLNQARL